MNFHHLRKILVAILLIVALTLSFWLNFSQKNPFQFLEIQAQIDPEVIDSFNDTSKIATSTNLNIDTSAGQVKLATWNCWGIGSQCDAGCLYSSPGPTSYYTNPGCSASCSVAGTFYVPSGTCSSDGTGSCYKMGPATSQYTSCTKGSGCGGECKNKSGYWCDDFTSEFKCESCSGAGCTWFDPWSECWGGTLQCSNYTTQSSCNGCSGCYWTWNKWNWNLGGLTSGYSSYSSCTWLKYPTNGSLTSKNLLAGLANVGPIDSFYYNASSIPANTTLRFQFSKDGTDWYNSAGTLNGWDNATTTGGATISLSGLGWYGPNFYYRAQFSTTDQSQTPVLDEIRLNYTNSVISISVNPSTFSYGSMGFSQQKRATEVSEVGASGIAVTNQSNVPVDLAIRGANASGPVTWTLASTPGPNQYVHQFATNIANPSWIALTTANQALFSNVAINSTKNFDLRLTMPTNTQTGIEMNVPVTIVATQAP